MTEARTAETEPLDDFDVEKLRAIIADPDRLVLASDDMYGEAGAADDVQYLVDFVRSVLDEGST